MKRTSRVHFAHSRSRAMSRYWSPSALLAVAVLLSLLSGGVAPVAAQGGAAVPAEAEYVPGQLLVKFRPWVSRRHVEGILGGENASRKGRIAPLGVDVLRLPPGLTVEHAIERFARMPEVAYAEPNYVLRAVQAPAEVTDQWALAMIEAEAAWAEVSNPAPPLLAVVDTGIDRTHPDLDANIWTNPDEVADNGLDDDGNGRVDDIWGWDLVNDDNDPMDDNMHGTAVSSVAAGERDGSGVAGVCHWCRLVAVKVLGADGAGSLDVVANGIIYAADLGADVINLSLGATIGAATLQNAVDYAWTAGAVVVAAAGNNGAEVLFYPAAYANAMAVASTNSEDYRSCFSNYYQEFVDVAAPGEAIWTATPNGGYGTYSGTSLAAPHVTGLAGLLFSQDASRSNATVRSIIETTTEDLGPVGSDAFFGTGRINAYRAVMGDSSATTPPAGMFPSSADASGYAHARKLARDGSGVLHMAWHDRAGTLYQIRYATSSDDGVTWSDPEVVFESAAATFHPALALGSDRVFIAFPTKDGSSSYRTQFAWKTLSGGTWAAPTVLMGGAYDAVRPDLHVEEMGVVHAAAASFDNAPSIYYISSSNGGESWGQVRSVGVGFNSRYADVYASNGRVYIAGRTVQLLYGLIPIYRAFSIHSLDGGQTWNPRTDLAQYTGWGSGEYGMSLAGLGDQLGLVYEHGGSIYFRHSAGGASWSGEQSLGTGAWPSITQGTDGQVWAMWTRDANVILRHYTGSAWETEDSLGAGTYPNLKQGTSGGRVEWALTYCSGAPFRLATGARVVGGGNQAPVAGDVSGVTDEDVQGSWVPTVSDPDGDGLTCTAGSTSAQGGAVTVASDCGSGTYAPARDFYGTDTFVYSACDPGGLCDAGTVTYEVAPIGDPPVATDDSATVDEDATVDIPVLANDSDADGDLLSIVEVTGPLNGVGSISAENTVVYAPTRDYCGADTLTYTVSDGQDGTDTADVTIEVTCVNDPPVANDDVTTTLEDMAVTVDVASNDTDVDANLDPASTVLTGGPANGGVSRNADGTFTYIPNPGFSGTDTFAYRIYDTAGLSDAATVTITVTPENDPPVASFTYACAGLTCDFTSNSGDVDGSIASYLWDFGDGTLTATGATVRHEYSAAGTYDVVLAVTDDAGASDSFSRQVAVSQAAAVHVGDLEGDPFKVRNKWNPRVTIHVHNQGEDDVAEATVTGTWSGGVSGTDSCTTDGSGTCSVSQTGLATKISSVTFTVDAVVSSVGPYDPSANHDLDGDTDGMTIVVYLDPQTNLPPAASFTYSCTDLTCEFDASGSYDPEGSALSYVWDLGDGAVASTALVTHGYAETGVYAVRLTVTDTGGASSSDTQQVAVGGAALPPMHVAGLEGSGSLSNKKFWKATVTTTVQDQAGDPVEGATVEGTWGEGASGTGTCTTGSSGACSITSSQISVGVDAVTFAVTTVTHPWHEYVPGLLTTVEVPQQAQSALLP